MVREEKKEEELDWPLFEDEDYGVSESIKGDQGEEWPSFSLSHFEDEELGTKEFEFAEPIISEKSPVDVVISAKSQDDVKLEGEREALPKDDKKKVEAEDNALGYEPEPTSPAFEEPEERKVDVGKVDVAKAQAVDQSELHLTDVGWETTGFPIAARPSRRRPVSVAPPLPRIPARVPRAPAAEEKVVPCPALLVGSKLDKVCPIRPGRWVEVGRNSKAQVLIQDIAVSKHHCKLLWKKSGSTVELRVLDGITHVNDRRLQVGSSLSLKHGDLLKIHGKGNCFRLLLDMQPVDPKLPGVRTLPNFTQKEVVQAPRSQEDELRRKIKKFKALADAAREKSMLTEQKLTEIQSRRKLRAMEVETTLGKSRNYEKDALRLEDVLIKSRDGWLERMQSQAETHHRDAVPLTEVLSETQTKLDTLHQLRKEKERALNPELYRDPKEEVSEDKRLDINEGLEDAEQEKDEDVDGEDEAFPDAPTGVKEDKLKDEKLDKPMIEVLPIAPTGADADVADLFGDFDSGDEAPVDTGMKRPAPDPGSEPSPKKARGEDDSDDDAPLSASIKRPAADPVSEPSPKKAGGEELDSTLSA